MMDGFCDSAGHTRDLRPQGAGRSWRRWPPRKVGGRRQEARPERPGHAWPITNRLAGARVWPRRPATSPRVPRSRADPSVWPGRELRRTVGRCPATAAPRPWHRLRLLRQIRDELVAGVEQFLFVDDGVAVEDRPAFVPGQEYGDPLGYAGAGSGCGRRRRRQSWRKRVGTPAAWQAVRHAVRQRRMGMPSRCVRRRSARRRVAE